jgi:N-acetylglutamate synthase-like GNAT family acetyltransferase
MAESLRYEISQALKSDLSAVKSFYSSVGYGGGVGDQDQVLICRQGRVVVAAVKLSPEGGTLVLRGMYVSAALRGQGIGARLLERISEKIGSSRCWCIPYTHLERFYSGIGFSTVESGEAPNFLKARLAGYVAAGHAVLIMSRPESWVSGAC